jgi:putative intracellular protease/amidase
MDSHGKTIGTLVEDQLEDFELWRPLFRLREAGAEVEAVALFIA